MASLVDKSLVTFIGHPFSSIGVGAQIRSHVRAAASVGLDVAVLDIFGHQKSVDRDHAELIEARRRENATGGVRVFHINGDEVENALAHLQSRGLIFEEGYNIIVPAWELPVYPTVWLPALNKFNEVWSLSKFIQRSLEAVGLSSHHVGQSVEVSHRPSLSRRYFGIRESAFVFLNFFDLSSFVERKNPTAVTEMFLALKRRRPFDDIQLVLKVKSGDRAAEEWVASLRNEVPDAVVIGQVLSEYETESLIKACDCFVSLHRSEGFGRGSGEAMACGKVALATGWSGNLDFMNKENSLLVDFQMIPVKECDYPQASGQMWANPDVHHAEALCLKVLDDADFRRQITTRSRIDIMHAASNRAVGLRVLDGIEKVSLPA